MRKHGSHYVMYATLLGFPLFLVLRPSSTPRAWTWRITVPPLPSSAPTRSSSPRDEQSYNPDGPVDTSYASALQGDIRALMGDCPGAEPIRSQ